MDSRIEALSIDLPALQKAMQSAQEDIELLPIRKTRPSQIIKGVINLQPLRGRTDTSHRLRRRRAPGTREVTVEPIENPRFLPFV
jgi:hypothetical protein